MITSPSKIICFRECPELYKWKYIDGNIEETSSMELGTLVDMRIFERAKFDAKYAENIIPTASNDLSLVSLKDLCEKYGLKVSGTKAVLISRIREKHELEPQIDELLEKLSSQGREVLPPALMAKVILISDKITNHPNFKKFSEGAVYQTKDEFELDGNTIRFKPDMHNSIGNTNICLDLKVTKDWQPKWFERAIFENGWHIQGAAYLEGLTKKTGKRFDRFVNITVEPKPPYRIRFYELDDGTLDAGLTELKYYLKELEDRTKRNDWSPRGEEGKIMSASLKSYDWDKVPEIVYE